MPKIQPTDTPILYRVETVVETVTGETPVGALTGAGDTASVITAAGETEYMAAIVAATAEFPTMPAAGTLLHRGEIYAWGDGDDLYMVCQDHTRTEHDPDTVLALFIVYREDAEGPLDWIAGEQVIVGLLRVYDGATYRCIQAHVTQSDWTPPSVPSLWAVVEVPVEGPQPWVQPQGAHDAYAIGAQVTHNSHLWENTTAANVWEPGVYGWNDLGAL